MARKPTFDRSAALRSIVGEGLAQQEPEAVQEAAPVEETRQPQQQEAVREEAAREPSPPPSSSSLVRPPVKAEKRTVRKHVLLTPTLSRKAEERAGEMGLSLNEVINQLLAYWVEE